MATITFSCTSCNQMLKVSADNAGKKVRCAKCQTILTIPESGDEQIKPVATAVPTPLRGAPPPIPDDEIDEEPVRRRRARRDDDYDDDDRPRRRASRRNNFAFDGTAGTFFGTALLAALLTLFTAGIGFPWAFCMIQRWKAEHTLVEGRRLAFHGEGLGLLGNWLLWYLLTLITLGIYVFWMVPAFQRWIFDNTDFADA